MKDIKELSFLLIPYFFLCSGLYHIAYWDTFEINGLIYIKYSDLIKSFIYPFLTFGFPIILGISFAEFLLRKKDWFLSKSQIDSCKSQLLFKSNVSIVLSIVWGFIVIYTYSLESPERWRYWWIFTSLVPYFLLYKSGFLSSYFTNRYIRDFLIRIIVAIPLLSFSSGKYESELIYHNIKYKYIINFKPDDTNNHFTLDTIKLIGSSNQYFFMMELNNSNILMIKSENLDTLRLYQY